jgi:hypothetical protein
MPDPGADGPVASWAPPLSSKRDGWLVSGATFKIDLLQSRLERPPKSRSKAVTLKGRNNPDLDNSIGWLGTHPLRST